MLWEIIRLFFVLINFSNSWNTVITFLRIKLFIYFISFNFIITHEFFFFLCFIFEISFFQDQVSLVTLVTYILQVSFPHKLFCLNCSNSLGLFDWFLLALDSRSVHLSPTPFSFHIVQDKGLYMTLRIIIQREMNIRSNYLILCTYLTSLSFGIIYVCVKIYLYIYLHYYYIYKYICI